MFKAHRLVYHSTLGLRVIKNKEKRRADGRRGTEGASLGAGKGFRACKIQARGKNVKKVKVARQPDMCGARVWG